MKKSMQAIWILTLMLSLLFLHAAPITYVKANADVPIPANAVSGSKDVNENDSDKIASLTSLIVMYSEQLEEYDRSNAVFVITCISICGVVLGLAVTFVSERKEIKRPNYALAAVFAMLPGIMTLCLYVFSMQCRRVAFFRGYLIYLEEKLSEMIDIPIIYNYAVVPKFFGEFTTNTLGPAIMAVFVVILFIASIVLCGYFAKSPSATSKIRWMETGARLMLILVFIVSIFFCAICVRNLAGNGPIPDEVYSHCINFVK